MAGRSAVTGAPWSRAPRRIAPCHGKKPRPDQFVGWSRKHCPIHHGECRHPGIVFGVGRMQGACRLRWLVDEDRHACTTVVPRSSGHCFATMASSRSIGPWRSCAPAGPSSVGGARRAADHGCLRCHRTLGAGGVRALGQQRSILSQVPRRGSGPGGRWTRRSWRLPVSTGLR